MKEILNLLKNPNNLHLLFLILPIYTFYQMDNSLLFIFSIVVFAILFCYRLDFLHKKSKIIEGRVKTKRKKKIPLKNWRGLWRRANEEFGDYLFCWPFFGIISLGFMALFIISTIKSYNYSVFFFGLHLFFIVFMLLLNLILNHNFGILAKRGRKKK